MNDLSQQLFDFAPEQRPPIILSNGYGLNSLAVIVGLRRLGIIPDLIIHADVGSEKADTKAYEPIFDAYLAAHGLPACVTVRYQPSDYKHWPPYHSLEENLLTNVTYPSIAYGWHSCSIKWKIAPINAYVKRWPKAVDCWARGGKVIKIIGYDAGGRDLKRCSTFQAKENSADAALYDFWHPLQEWGWDRDRCLEEVRAEGLPDTPKSSCYFCTSMKPAEVRKLTFNELCRIVIIEARAQWRQRKVQGLWRRAVKGTRGGEAKPGLMTTFIRQESLLPALVIDRLMAATPTQYLHAGDIADWQTWIEDLITAAAGTGALRLPIPAPGTIDCLVE